MDAARLAGEVIAGADAELLAVPPVVAHQRVHLGGVPPAAREAAVDGPDGGAEPHGTAWCALLIQDQSAALKETTGSFATRSGSRSRSTPMLSPAGP